MPQGYHAAWDTVPQGITIGQCLLEAFGTKAGFNRFAPACTRAHAHTHSAAQHSTAQLTNKHTRTLTNTRTHSTRSQHALACTHAELHCSPTASRLAPLLWIVCCGLVGWAMRWRTPAP